MDVTDRFAACWKRWDAHVRRREDAAPYLSSAKDEELLELLAGASERDRKYERDVVATEIKNRLARRALAHPEGAEEVFRAALRAHESAATAQRPIHAAENLLKASGEEELGVSVSATANASLEATKMAMAAAQAHVAELQAAQAQSRIAERLVEDAAQTAQEAAANAVAGAKRVAELGHKAEAEAARKAARHIREAAQKLEAAKDGND